jgi:hypothetical protein
VVAQAVLDMAAAAVQVAWFIYKMLVLSMVTQWRFPLAAAEQALTHPLVVMEPQALVVVIQL